MKAQCGNHRQQFGEASWFWLKHIKLDVYMLYHFIMEFWSQE